jgi:hypothetical protein
VKLKDERRASFDSPIDLSGGSPVSMRKWDLEEPQPEKLNKKLASMARITKRPRKF